MNNMNNINNSKNSILAKQFPQILENIELGNEVDFWETYDGVVICECGDIMFATEYTDKSKAYAALSKLMILISNN